MRKPVYILIALFLTVSAVLGNSIGELRKSLDRENNVDSLAMINNLLARKYISIDVDSSFYFAKQGLALSESNEFLLGIAENAAALADCYIVSDSLEQAEEYYLIASEYFELARKPFELAEVLLVLGNIYLSQNNYAEALINYQKSKEISEDNDFSPVLAHLHNNMGIIYMELGEMEKAGKNYNLAYNLFDQQNLQIPKAKALLNLALTFDNSDNDSLKMNYYLEALKIYIAAGAEVEVSSVYNNLGNLKLKNKEYDRAYDYYKQGYDICKKPDGNYRGPRSFHMVDLLINYGWTSWLTGNPDDAKTLLYQSIQLAQQNQYLSKYALGASYLSTIYEAQNQMDSAYKYHKVYKQVSDSVLNEGSVKKITQLEMQYEFDRKMKEKELAEARNKVAQQKREFIYLMITLGVVFIAIVSILLFLYQRNKAYQSNLKRENLELEKENLNQKLEYKNKELATNVMYLIKKNEIITTAAERLTRAKIEFTKENQKLIQFIIKDLENNASSDIWEEFELRFKEVHSEFYEKLNQLYPDLTPNEQRLCAFLRLNMSTKEISSITFQSLRSINMARFRLRKKLDIDRDDNLITFLAQL